MPDRAFPPFLARVYSPIKLDHVESAIAVIDPETAILWVNAAWETFAGATSAKVGPTYLGGITGELRTYFGDVFAQALATGAPYEQDYECSSPDEIRTFRMRVLPFSPHGLVVEHTQIATATAPEGEPPDAARYLDATGQIVQCSNCRRVRLPTDGDGGEHWAWIPALVARSHPRTSHGICTPCVGFYWRFGR